MTVPADTTLPASRPNRGWFGTTISILFVPLASAVVGVVLHRQLGVPVPQAVLVAITTFSALVAVYAIVRRSRTISALNGEIDDLKAQLAGLQPGPVAQRTTALPPLPGADAAGTHERQPRKAPPAWALPPAANAAEATTFAETGHAGTAMPATSKPKAALPSSTRASKVGPSRHPAFRGHPTRPPELPATWYPQDWTRNRRVPVVGALVRRSRSPSHHRASNHRAWPWSPPTRRTGHPNGRGAHLNLPSPWRLIPEARPWPRRRPASPITPRPVPCRCWIATPAGRFGPSIRQPRLGRAIPWHHRWARLHL